MIVSVQGVGTSTQQSLSQVVESKIAKCKGCFPVGFKRLRDVIFDSQRPVPVIN